MRHNNKIKKIGRGSAHRSAMLTNMACSLIEHKRINTTIAKARALRMFVEPVITKCKTDSTHSRRVVFGLLKNKEAVSELFREVAPKIADRPGGYTRIIKMGSRVGDGADMAMIELVDFNDLYGKEEKKKTRRSRRSSTSSEAKAKAPAAEAPAKEEKVEAPKEAKAKVEAEAAPKAETKVEEEKKDSKE